MHYSAQKEIISFSTNKNCSKKIGVWTREVLFTDPPNGEFYELFFTSRELINVKFCLIDYLNNNSEHQKRHI